MTRLKGPQREILFTQPSTHTQGPSLPALAVLHAPAPPPPVASASLSHPALPTIHGPAPCLSPQKVAVLSLLWVLFPAEHVRRR